MRKALGVLSVAALALGVQFAAAQDSSQTQSQSQTQTSAKPATSKPQAQRESVADAARKARDEQKSTAKAPVVFTNDNIGATASSGTVNVVGTATPAPKSSDSTSTEGAAEGDKSSSASGASSNDESAWRSRFSTARSKLQQDQEALGVMQRELQQLRVQYYPNDPQKAMKQSYSNDDVFKKQQAIDKKQKEIQADQQALSNLQDELRKAGGDPSWARE